jgi:hypothetical protein
VARERKQFKNKSLSQKMVDSKAEAGKIQDGLRIFCGSIKYEGAKND